MSNTKTIEQQQEDICVAMIELANMAYAAGRAGAAPWLSDVNFKLDSIQLKITQLLAQVRKETIAEVANLRK